MPELSSAEWKAYLKHYPNAHLLQTAEWGELKAAFGWKVVRIVTGENGGTGAQVLFRKLPLGLTFGYIPKGPLGEHHRCHYNEELWCNQRIDGEKDLWVELDRLCRRERAVFLKLEPDLWRKENNRKDDNPPSGFLMSRHSIQPLRTLVVDLQGDEQTILSRMKQKTRYNIRLATKKGVSVHDSDDIDMFYRLLQVTSQRDGFSVHHPSYYCLVYSLFRPQDECRLFVAEYKGEPLAAIMVFVHGERAWYFYGASSDEHRELMPTYLLQWEAMRWAKQRGCLTYDLWGVPDENFGVLEAQFIQRVDGLWGVYRFKRGFGGKLMRSPGPWDRVYQPLLYTFYRWWFKGSMG